MIIGISIRLNYPDTEDGRAVMRAVEIARELGNQAQEEDIPMEVKVKVDHHVVHRTGGV